MTWYSGFSQFFATHSKELIVALVGGALLAAICSTGVVWWWKYVPFTMEWKGVAHIALNSGNLLVPYAVWEGKASSVALDVGVQVEGGIVEFLRKALILDRSLEAEVFKELEGVISQLQVSSVSMDNPLVGGSTTNTTLHIEFSTRIRGPVAEKALSLEVFKPKERFGSLMLRIFYREGKRERYQDIVVPMCFWRETEEPPRPLADAEAPFLLVRTAPLHWSAGEEVAFFWSASDNLTPRSEIQFRQRLQNGEWSRWSGQDSRVLGGLPVGSYTFYVEARDNTGNKTIKSCDFSVGSPCQKVEVAPIRLLGGINVNWGITGSWFGLVIDPETGYLVRLDVGHYDNITPDYQPPVECDRLDASVLFPVFSHSIFDVLVGPGLGLYRLPRDRWECPTIRGLVGLVGKGSAASLYGQIEAIVGIYKEPFFYLTFGFGAELRFLFVNDY